MNTEPTCKDSNPKSSSQSLENSKLLLKKIGDLFGVNYRIVLDDSLCGFGSTTIDDDFIVEGCLQDFINMDNGLCGEHSKDSLAFIIAHEAAHNLLKAPHNYSYENAITEIAKSCEHLPVEKKKIINEYISTTRYKEFDDNIALQKYIFWLGANQEHEYVDGLAAKILKTLGYSDNIKHGIECIKKHYPEAIIPDKYVGNRVGAIERAYSEGWSDWSDYKSIYPLTDGAPLKMYLKENKHTKTLGVLNNSGKLEKSELLNEIYRRHQRYSNTIRH